MCWFILPSISFSQTGSVNWKVFLNSDTIPLRLYHEITEDVIMVDSENDRLTFTKTKGQPRRGKIKFISGKGIPSGMNYPMPVAKFKINEPTVVNLYKVAKVYKPESWPGKYIQLVEVYNRTIQPIVVIQFKTSR